jgi:5,10-methylenetetrahydrofolate reductase
MGEFQSPYQSPYLDQLLGGGGTLTVELRPPAAGQSGPETMEAWIDTHHSVRRLVRKDRFLFLTDNAVGAAEEENLAHLGANLSEEVDPGGIAPFLTCKHSLEHCLMYAERAWAQGFRALAVLGGDQQEGAPRCLPHAYQLRRQIRNRIPGMALGGWANPHKDAVEQAGYLARPEFTAEFWLSQVVSHHSIDLVEGFLEQVASQGVQLPGVFGVFYYRSGNPRTLQVLSEFFPVPAEALIREFEEGATPEEVCARSIRALRRLGVKNLYVSNLPLRRGAAALDRILGLV